MAERNTYSILRDPDLDFVVKLASLECYGQLVEDEIIRENSLRKIGACFKKLRDMGPDPEHIEYAHADLMDVDTRIRLRAELRLAMDELDELNLPDVDNNMEEDEFLELMINNISLLCFFYPHCLAIFLVGAAHGRTTPLTGCRTGSRRS